MIDPSYAYAARPRCLSVLKGWDDGNVESMPYLIVFIVENSACQFSQQAALAQWAPYPLRFWTIISLVTAASRIPDAGALSAVTIAPKAIGSFPSSSVK